MPISPYRSALYIPGSKARALEKARGLACDAILFDLEDAVAPDAKDEARASLVAALRAGGYGARQRIVRVNGLETGWGGADIAALSGVPLDGVLLPKVGAAADVARARQRMDRAGFQAPVWAMIETPDGVMAAREIARAPGMAGFVLGTNDLAKELGATGRAAMTTALQWSLLAARGAGIVAIDGVFNAFRDVEGLEAECIEGRDWGFDGKSLIHPAQLEVANRIFAPSADALDLARRQIAAFEDAEAAGQGVAVVDGRIVENLHVATARATLAKAAAIAAMED